MAVPLKIVGVSGASLGVAGLGGYAVYSHIQSNKKETSYRSKLSHALLELSGATHQANWGKRLTSLKSVDESTLVSELVALKKKQTPDATWQEVQAWCRENIDGNFSDENELKFKNLRTYCVFSISEKISNVIASTVAHSESSWATAFTNFGNYSGTLSSEFKTLKSKSDKNAEKFKETCVRYYDEPFLSESDEEFMTVKAVCVQQQG